MKIQNLICTLFIVLLLITTISAQNFRVGAVGGINLASVSTDMEDSEPNTLTTFGVGGVIDWNLGGNLALCFEPMYLKKGAKIEFPATEEEDFDIFGNIEGKFDFAYIEIPVLLKYSFGSGGIKPYLMAGPTIGILSKAEMELTMMEIATFSIDIKDYSESIDYGVGLGAGISIPIGSNSLFVEGRYALGLSDVFKGTGPVENEDDLELEDSEVKHRGIHIFAGLSIPLGE